MIRLWGEMVISKKVGRFRRRSCIGCDWTLPGGNDFRKIGAVKNHVRKDLTALMHFRLYS